MEDASDLRPYPLVLQAAAKNFEMGQEGQSFEFRLSLSAPSVVKRLEYVAKLGLARETSADHAIACSPTSACLDIPNQSTDWLRRGARRGHVLERTRISTASVKTNIGSRCCPELRRRQLHSALKLSQNQPPPIRVVSGI